MRPSDCSLGFFIVIIIFVIVVALGCAIGAFYSRLAHPCTASFGDATAWADVEVLEIDYSLPFLKRHFPRVRVWSFLAGWVCPPPSPFPLVSCVVAVRALRWETPLPFLLVSDAKLE